MELLYAIGAFIFMPVVFYILAALLILGIALNIDNDKYDGEGWGWASIFSIGLVYLVSQFFGIPLFSAIRENAVMIAAAVAGYLALGVAWSFGKWYFKLSNIRDVYVELKEKYLEKNKPEHFMQRPTEYFDGQTREDVQLREAIITANKEYASYITNRMQVYTDLSAATIASEPNRIVDLIKPLAARHKSTITQWIAFWPVSLTWTLLNDPIRKLANYIFSKIKNTFQRMSDSMFAGV